MIVRRAEEDIERTNVGKREGGVLFIERVTHLCAYSVVYF
jgi:hypothetical protein